MSPYELQRAIYIYYDGNVSDTIIEMNDLINKIKDNPNKLANQLLIQVDELADKTNNCPKCGSEIVQLNKWNENRGEMYGQPVNETIYEYGCESCGYIKE